MLVLTVAIVSCAESRQACGACGNLVSDSGKICAPAPSAFPVFFSFEKEDEPAPKEQEIHGRDLMLSRERKSQLKVRYSVPLNSLEAHVTLRAPGPAVM